MGKSCCVYQNIIINSEDPFLQIKATIVMEVPSEPSNKYTEKNLNKLSHELMIKTFPVFNGLVKEIFK